MLSWWQWRRRWWLSWLSDDSQVDNRANREKCVCTDGNQTPQDKYSLTVLWPDKWKWLLNIIIIIMIKFVVKTKNTDRKKTPKTNIGNRFCQQNREMMIGDQHRNHVDDHHVDDHDDDHEDNCGHDLGNVCRWKWGFERQTHLSIISPLFKHRHHHRHCYHHHHHYDHHDDHHHYDHNEWLKSSHTQSRNPD